MGSTVDYGEDDRLLDFLGESDDESEPDSSSWKTRPDQACVECLDGILFWTPGVLGNEVWLSESEVSDGDSSLVEPLALHLSNEMSKLYCSDGPQLPALGTDGHHVVQLFPSGVKRTVVERANNILSFDEARANEAAVNRAMLEELTSSRRLSACPSDLRRTSSTPVGSSNGKRSTVSERSKHASWSVDSRTRRQNSFRRSWGQHRDGANAS